MQPGTSLPGHALDREYMDDDPRLLSHNHLVMLRDQVLGPEEDLVMDMTSIAKQLVEHALATADINLQLRLEAQNRLAGCQASLESAVASAQFERERFKVEQDQLMLQSQALAHKLIRARRDLTTVGSGSAASNLLPAVYQAPNVYGQHLSPRAHASRYGGGGDEQVPEAQAPFSSLSQHPKPAQPSGEARALLSDVKFLKRRLRDSEYHVARLQGELRRFRAFFLHGGPTISTSYEVLLPPPTTSHDDVGNGTWSRSAAMRQSTAVTGDAEAEHLILAGKRLSKVRRIVKVPLDEAIKRQAEDIILADYPELAMPMSPVAAADSRQGDAEEDENEEEDEQENKTLDYDDGTQGQELYDVSFTNRRHGTQSIHASPGSTISVAIDKKGKGRADQDETKLDERLSIPRSDSSLRETPRYSGSVSASGSRSSQKRRREIGDAGNGSAAWRPVSAKALQRIQGGESNLGDKDDSMLESDVLAEASGSLSRPRADAGAQAGPSKPSNRTASAYGKQPTNKIKGPRDGGSAVGAKSAPGIDADSVEDGKPKAHRSPYIKWSHEEDEQLVRSVIEHGLRWDVVSAQIPSRTYHQVRQRFLRGLKLGQAVPDELAHLGDACRASVKMYEDQKKANKTRKLERRQAALAVAASTLSASTSQDQGMAVVSDDDDDFEDYDDDDHEREGLDSRGGEVGSQRVENKERARDDAGNVG